MVQFSPNQYVVPTSLVRFRARATWSGYISGATLTPSLLTEDSKPLLKQVCMNISLSLVMYVLGRIKCFSSVYLYILSYAYLYSIEFPCELECLFGDQNHAKYTLLYWKKNRPVKQRQKRKNTFLESPILVLWRALRYGLLAKIRYVTNHLILQC